MTTIEGLYITDFCKDNIAVSDDVKKEMEELRSPRRLELCICPIYKADEVPLEVCFLNARSLHKHMMDVCNDFNYSSTDVSIFSATRFSSSDNNDEYVINGYELFRIDSVASANVGQTIWWNGYLL